MKIFIKTYSNKIEKDITKVFPIRWKNFFKKIFFPIQQKNFYFTIIYSIILLER